MSISSIITKNDFLDVSEKLGFEWKLHKHEIIVGAIMATVSIAMVIAMTGDLNQAFAGVRRH